MRPASARIRLVLPAPFGPRITVTRPGCRLSESRSTTVRWPSWTDISVTRITPICAVIAPAMGKPLSDGYLIQVLTFAAGIYGLKTFEKTKGVA